MITKILSKISDFTQQAYTKYWIYERRKIFMEEPNYELLDGMLDFEKLLSPFCLALLAGDIEPGALARTRISHYNRIIKTTNDEITKLLFLILLDKHLPLAAYPNPIGKDQNGLPEIPRQFDPDLQPGCSQWSLGIYSDELYYSLCNTGNQSEVSGIAASKNCEKYHIDAPVDDHNTGICNMIMKAFGKRCGIRDNKKLSKSWCFPDTERDERQSDASRRRKEHGRKWQAENKEFLFQVIKCHRLGNYIGAKYQPMGTERLEILRDSIASKDNFVLECFDKDESITLIIQEFIGVFLDSDIVLKKTGELAGLEEVYVKRSRCSGDMLRRYNRKYIEFVTADEPYDGFDNFTVGRKTVVDWLYHCAIRTPEVTQKKTFAESLLGDIVKYVNQDVYQELISVVEPLDFRLVYELANEMDRPPWGRFVDLGFNDTAISLLRTSEVIYLSHIKIKTAATLFKSLPIKSLRDLFAILYIATESKKCTCCVLPRHFYDAQSKVLQQRKDKFQVDDRHVYVCDVCKQLKTTLHDESTVGKMRRKSKNVRIPTESGCVTRVEGVTKNGSVFTCNTTKREPKVHGDYINLPIEVPPEIREILDYPLDTLWKMIEEEDPDLELQTEKPVVAPTNFDISDIKGKKKYKVLLVQRLANIILGQFMPMKCQGTPYYQIPKAGLMIFNHNKRVVSCFRCGQSSYFDLRNFVGSEYLCFNCYHTVNSLRKAKERACIICSGPGISKIELEDMNGYLCERHQTSISKEMALSLSGEDFRKLVKTEFSRPEAIGRFRTSKKCGSKQSFIRAAEYGFKMIKKGYRIKNDQESSN